GFQRIGDNNSVPNRSPLDNYQWTDNLTRIRGNHTLKLGADIVRNRMTIVFDANDRGAINFTPRFTTSGPGASGGDAHAFADFLLGLVTSSNRRTEPIVQDVGQHWLTGYLQDDWKVRRSLSLQLGLRYEIWRRPVEATNRMSELEIFRTPAPTFIV